MKYLQNILIAVAILLAGFGVYKAETVNVSAPTLGSVNPVTPAVFETYLANAEGTGDTSLTLASASLRDGNILSGYVCLTIDSNTSSLEYECGTASGTTVSSLQRGIDASTGTTTISSLIFAHRRGADVKITDYPTLTIVNNQLSGIQTIGSLLQYASNLLITAGSASTTIATKYYVDQTAVSGAPNANTTTKGIIQLATGLQAASSTATGSTGAYLVLPSSIATDTPNVGTNTSDVIMSNLLGYINQGWLNLAQAFNVSGLWTFSGGATFNTATTTFTGPVVTTENTIVVNTVAYQFPSANSLGILRDDGTGILSWGNPVKYGYSGAGPSASGGGAISYASTTLMVIPALTASSTIQIDISGHCYYNGGCGTWQLALSDGTPVGPAIDWGDGTNSSASYGEQHVVILFNSATSQKYMYNGVGGLPLAIQGGIGTSAVNFSTSKTLVMVANNVSAGAGNTSVVDALSVIVNP